MESDRLVVPRSVAEEAAEETQEEHGYSLPDPTDSETEREEWTAVFVIGINKEGGAVCSEKVEEFLADKAFQRIATRNDFWVGAAQIMRDMESISTAQRVMMNMQMLGAAVSAQMESEQITANLRREEMAKLNRKKH